MVNSYAFNEIMCGCIPYNILKVSIEPYINKVGIIIQHFLYMWCDGIKKECLIKQKVESCEVNSFERMSAFVSIFSKF